MPTVVWHVALCVSLLFVSRGFADFAREKPGLVLAFVHNSARCAGPRTSAEVDILVCSAVWCNEADTSTRPSMLAVWIVDERFEGGAIVLDVGRGGDRATEVGDGPVVYNPIRKLHAYVRTYAHTNPHTCTHGTNVQLVVTDTVVVKLAELMIAASE